MVNLKKIQNLPLSARKIILWSVSVLLGILLVFMCIRNFQEKIKNFQMEKISFPNLQEELKNIPEVEIPNNQ